MRAFATAPARRPRAAAGASTGRAPSIAPEHVVVEVEPGEEHDTGGERRRRARRRRRAAPPARTATVHHHARHGEEGCGRSTTPGRRSSTVSPKIRRRTRCVVICRPSQASGQRPEALPAAQQQPAGRRGRATNTVLAGPAQQALGQRRAIRGADQRRGHRPGEAGRQHAAMSAAASGGTKTGRAESMPSHNRPVRRGLASARCHASSGAAGHRHGTAAGGAAGGVCRPASTRSLSCHCPTWLWVRRYDQ